jgi:hypothetical protein
MLAEYWWVFVIIVLLLMIFYPKDKSEKFRNVNKNKQMKFNFKPVLHNLPTLTSYYIGIS